MKDRFAWVSGGGSGAATGILQIFICLLFVVMGSAVGMTYGVFLPNLVDAFEAPVGTVSLGVSIAMLATGLSSPVVGRLLDIKSLRGLLVVGGSLMVAGFLGNSLATTISYLLVGYVALGVGTSIFAPMVAVKHMTRWFPQRLGLATSLVCLPVSGVIYPPLTQWLIGEFGWRSAYHAYAVCTLAVILLLALLKPYPAGSEPDARNAPDKSSLARPDLSGAQIYKTLMGSGMFWFSTLAFSVYLAAPVSALTHLVVLSEEKGMTANDGVLFMTIMGVASLVGTPLCGLISDRYGPRFGYIMVALLQGVALLLLLGTSGYAQFAASAVILGLLMAGGLVFFIGFVTLVVGKETFGTGFGLATLILAVLTASPPTIAGRVYDAMGSFDWYFGGLAALTLVLGGATAALGNPREVVYNSEKAMGGEQ